MFFSVQNYRFTYNENFKNPIKFAGIYSCFLHELVRIVLISVGWNQLALYKLPV